MEIDRELHESSCRLFPASTGRQFCINRAPFGGNPSLINSEKCFAFILEMFIESPGRVSGLLRYPIRIGSVIADAIEDLPRRGHQAGARLLRCTPSGTIGDRCFLPAMAHGNIDSAPILMIVASPIVIQASLTQTRRTYALTFPYRETHV